MALTQVVLDQQGCGAEDCTHDHSVLHLHAQCHLKSALKVRYVKATGNMEVSCATCEASIAVIAVKPS